MKETIIIIIITIIIIIIIIIKREGVPMDTIVELNFCQNFPIR